MTFFLCKEGERLETLKRVETNAGGNSLQSVGAMTEKALSAMREERERETRK